MAKSESYGVIQVTEYQDGEREYEWIGNGSDIVEVSPDCLELMNEMPWRLEYIGNSLGGNFLYRRVGFST